MRCFVASFLTRVSAASLAAQVPTITDARPIPADDLHVTLLFLGDVEAADLQPVLQSVADLSGEASSARVTAVTGFPSRDRARAVVALLEVSERLHGWHSALAQAWPGAGRPFLPHVTLARSRAGVVVPDLSKLCGLPLELEPPGAYQSRTLASGARYSQLAKADANPHR